MLTSTPGTATSACLTRTAHRSYGQARKDCYSRTTSRTSELGLRFTPRVISTETDRSGSASTHRSTWPSWGQLRSSRSYVHGWATHRSRSEEHTSELQSRGHLVCRLLLEKKKQ